MTKSLMCRLTAMVLCLTLAGPGSCEILRATVTGGVVEGTFTDGVSAFKGIPFAAPPVGRLRWKSPQPVSDWSGVLSATQFAVPCAQEGGVHGRTSEDCLYLNIWTAAASDAERRPVMVWIHGGSFVAGATSSPSIDGTHFAKDGVVLVTVAYRLGAFGFLVHPDLSRESGKASGTYGIEDQITALRWVQANIERFGGDPARVTLFGESAGGIAVTLLAVSPLTKGLFQRVISESGPGTFLPPVSSDTDRTGGAPYTLAYAETVGKQFLHRLGANTIDAARRLSTDQILAAKPAALRKFWVVLDGAVLRQSDDQANATGPDVPVLVGFNSDESAADAPTSLTTGQFELLTKIMPCSTQAAPLLASYLHATDKQALRAFKDVLRDNDYAWSVWTWARLLAQAGQSKVFVYYFDVRSGPKSEGARHFAEVPYVFGNLGAQPQPHDQEISDLIRRYWIRFADSGDPNSPDLPSWPAFTLDTPRAMTFAQTASAQPFPGLARMPAFEPYMRCMRERARHSGERATPRSFLMWALAAAIVIGITWRIVRRRRRPPAPA
jgi:para-nitrobenzyl esterase